MKLQENKQNALPPLKEQTEVSLYTSTTQERAIIEAVIARRKTKPPSPTVNIIDDKQDGFKIQAPDLPLMEYTLSSSSLNFMSGILNQLRSTLSPGKNPDQEAMNFGLAVISGIAPRDEIETLLAVQMAAIHAATVTSARNLAHAENIQQQDSAERTLNKLARTFTTQMEALKRYRTAGLQTVKVEHVHVNEGGQAIIGNVDRDKDRRGE